MVTIIFIVMLLSIIYNLLIQYSAIDMVKPFDRNNFLIFTDIIRLVNKTIKATDSCETGRDNLKKRLEDISYHIEKNYPLFSVAFEYTVDCTKWDNKYPSEPPLNITLRVIGEGGDIQGKFKFYHNY